MNTTEKIKLIIPYNGNEFLSFPSEGKMLPCLNILVIPKDGRGFLNRILETDLKNYCLETDYFENLVKISIKAEDSKWNLDEMLDIAIKILNF